VTARAGSPRVVLGVSGGIAAYKACSLLRLLTESGVDVQVVATEAALRFVGAATWAALSGHPVRTGVWDDADQVPHVRLGQQAELVVVAPATADLLARAAHGLADDLLTSTLLTARCPVLLAPAMHTEMWQHPATVANVATLRGRGVMVLDPATGRLTGADSGPGRLPEPEELFAAASALLARAGAVAGDLAGLRIAISAGGTREPLDPVRFLGNRSSGRQGMALAATALARGAQVDLVAANIDLAPPPGARVHRVETAEELRAAMFDAAAGADVVVMAAAVADYRPANVAEHKLKKDDGGGGLQLALERTPDVLAELVARRAAAGSRQVIVGFAAETGDPTTGVLEHGRRKLARKGCDLLVVNDVSAGKVFGRGDTEVCVLAPDGAQLALPPGDKHAVAAAIWDIVVSRLPDRVRPATEPMTATTTGTP
jgi:phosphopantothenoylcysteine decarboxylase / phosphopantothenate---cysteine ligase